jgi:hypothetical protein
MLLYRRRMPQQDGMRAVSVRRSCGTWGFALWAAFLFSGWAGACGKTSQGVGRPLDGSSGGAGGSQTDAVTGSGGAAGAGGGTGDAGVGLACSDDAGLGFAAAARQCTQDSDCTIHVAATCCGTDSAFGIAKDQASTYSSCFAFSSGACSGLGCPKYGGYQTDTGKITPFFGTDIQAMDLVSVQCVAHLCTTDVLTPAADAGQDAPPAADVAPETGSQACGKTTCYAGQACVLSSGGPAPRCQPPVDGGCDFGLVLTNSCDSYSGQFSPGCTDPIWSPGCVDLPDACSDLCGCVCHSGGGGGCIVTPEYVLCSYP